ncbi:hypothetical protein RhiirA1_461919, partial [Rhizophagus irregularis]
MEWYHQWESEYRAHKEEHELRTGELDECLNCELCHPIVDEPIVFKKFWDALFKNMVQKIIRIFIDTRGFTKEPEDSESEDSLESYEMKKNFNVSLYLRFERFRYWWNDKYEGKQIHTYHENDSLEWFEKMLSEGENLQEDTVRKLMDSMTFKDSEDIYTRDPIILRIDDGVIEWVVPDLKETMERTQKFKLVEIEQEEDNEIYDSEEEIEIIVEDKT